MKEVVSFTLLLMLVGCGDSTGPSQVIRHDLVAINTLSGGVIETVTLITSGCFETEISSDGNYLYVVDRKNLIHKFNLNSMTGELEQFIPGSDNYLISSALSGDDSLLFVQSSSGNLYKITTSNMAVVDTLKLEEYSVDGMEARPGTELLYLNSDGNQILILDALQMTFTDTLNIYLDSDIYFSDMGDEMYLSSVGFLYAYDPDTGEQLRSQFFPGIITRMEFPYGSNSIFILWCTLSGDDPDFTLVELDRSTFSTLETLENSPSRTFIRYSDLLSRLFLYPSADNGISVLDMPGFQLSGEVDMDEFVKSMILSPDQTRLYCLVYFNSTEDAD